MSALATFPMNSPSADRRAQVSIFRRIGVYMPALIVLGLGVPVLVYVTLMQSLGWRVPVITMHGAFGFSPSASKNVMLYASPASKAYYTQIGGNYEMLLSPWRNYFANRKLDYKELKEPAQLRDYRGGVLVVPSALALSDEERAEIQSFRSRGGALLATWASGSRNGKGEWAGWQFLESLGVKMVGEIPANAEIGHLIVNGESPVSHQLPAGQRIGLTRTAETLLRAKGEMTAARFMNWSRITDPERRDEGAILYAETGVSRSAYFAFAESAWESHPQLMYDVIDDTLQWLQRDPAIVRAAWPNGKRAAQIMEMDTEEGFPNALVFADMMRAIDYRATFYVLTSVGRRYPEVMSQLARQFEIGYHADVHDSFKGQPAKLQEQRMQIMRTEMSTVIPDISGLTGFRAPLEGYDETTEQLLQKFGIRHHAADPSRSDARLPLLAKLKGVETADALVVLPRTQRDDINLSGPNMMAAQVTTALIDDFNLALDNGALGLLSVHSQNFWPQGTLASAMPAFLDHVKQYRSQMWLASAGQVADWWRDRERFKLSSNRAGKRLEFFITITGKAPLSGASAIVMLPQKGTLPTVQPMKIGLPGPSVQKIDDYRAAIVFDTLKPGNYAYQLAF